MPYAWRWSLHWLEVMTILLWMEVWLILISPTRTLCRVVWPFRHPDTTLLRGGPPFFLVFLMIFLVAFRSYGTMLSASVIGPARRNPLDPLHVIGRVTHLSLFSTPCLQLWVILSVFFHLYCTLFSSSLVCMAISMYDVRFDMTLSFVPNEANQCTECAAVFKSRIKLAEPYLPSHQTCVHRIC